MNLNATILGQAIAFVLFVLFCMKYIWPPLMSAIEKRQKEIADSLASAELAKKDLDIAHTEANNHLKKAKTEAKEIIEQAYKRRAQVIDAAKAEAELERNKIIKQAHAEINAEYKRAREDLRKQISMLALAGAEKIIECSLDTSINSNIVDEFIAKLQAGKIDV